jgi:alkylation response protein AidB-like acyl-CoA dehydrogenase
MASKCVSERNLRFLLYDVFDAEAIARLRYFEEHNRDVFDLILDTALKMARDKLLPCFRDMDQNPPRLEQGEVKVHQSVRSIMAEWGEGGWIAASLPYEHGGQQLPSVVTLACNYVFSAANFSSTGFPLLTAGAAHLILTYGAEDLKETYVPHMLAGTWQGTMALTEPHAGSSLSDITTRAEPTDHGYYRMRGQKIFISAGDHDGVDNVVHMMLAKIPGGPPGAKGISLFLVPKKRVADDGSLEPNDVAAISVYHKMGYRGCPITQLSIGDGNDCRGYLVGEPHRGLSYMFQMMNEARLGVGMQATSIASAAYYAALEYAKERPQGRKLASKDPSLPQVPIVEHPDVKRMLLFQRAVSEGSLSLILQCARYADLMRSEDTLQAEKAGLLLDLLTPVAKSYPSEMGILSVSQGLQVLGGYGYCDEYPLEQHLRDSRIHPIHEGTTGIQAQDLLGRKVVMKNGRAMSLFLAELDATMQAASVYPALEPYGRRLKDACNTLQTVTMALVKVALKGEIERFLADATLYLEFFGIVAVAWQWLLQGVAAAKAMQGNASDADLSFCRGKIVTLQYFFHYELPKIQGLAARLVETDGLTAEIDRTAFSD